MDLSEWKGVVRPERRILEGRYTRLEPLDYDRHAQSLLEVTQSPDGIERYRYLPGEAPRNLSEFEDWLTKAVASEDPLFFAVVDQATGRVEGRQALMRIDEANGVIEMGHVYWGQAMARTRIATEAFYLFASYVFGLGYRRLEWKCNTMNTPSKRAAERFGFQFEGIFRQHMVVKGQNRDSAWFSILDHEWRRLNGEYARWLSPGNFDSSSVQLSKLNFESRG